MHPVEVPRLEADITLRSKWTCGYKYRIAAIGPYCPGLVKPRNFAIGKKTLSLFYAVDFADQLK